MQCDSLRCRIVFFCTLPLPVALGQTRPTTRAVQTPSYQTFAPHMLYPRGESNPNRWNRNPIFYPLNYGDSYPALLPPDSAFFGLAATVFAL